MHKTHLDIVVTGEHIAAARRSGQRTPVEVALLAQTAYLPAGFFDGAISLMDAEGGELLCEVSAGMQEFLEAFGSGKPVSPATFRLECEELSIRASDKV